MQLDELFSQEEMELLRIRAERVAASLEKQDSAGRIEALTLTMCGEKYALPIDEITVVYREVVIIPVPCVPDFVAGIANVRGHLVSVLDLTAVLGLQSAIDTGKATLLVAEAGDTRIGFRVEAIGEVIELPVSQMNPVPANMNLTRADYLRGIFPDGITLLNMKAILEDPRLVIDESVG